MIASLWEALIRIGLGIGLLTIFRELINRKAGRLVAFLSRAQYGANIIHLLVVVGVQIGLVDVSMSPFVKFLIATIIGIALSFEISHFLVRIPGVRKVL